MSKIQQPQIKTAEEAVARDAAAAIEAGFAKAAADMGITEEQFPAFYQAGVELIQKLK